LRRLKQTLAKKTKAPKLKSLREKQTKKNQLADLIFSVELRKKMDQVKQNIRKTD